MRILLVEDDNMIGQSLKSRRLRDAFASQRRFVHGTDALSRSEQAQVASINHND